MARPHRCRFASKQAIKKRSCFSRIHCGSFPGWETKREWAHPIDAFPSKLCFSKTSGSPEQTGELFSLVLQHQHVGCLQKNKTKLRLEVVIICLILNLPRTLCQTWLFDGPHNPTPYPALSSSRHITETRSSSQLNWLGTDASAVGSSGFLSGLRPTTLG